MLYEKAPPGREDQVKALKRKYGERAAYAIAWASYNKSKDKAVEESVVRRIVETSIKRHLDYARAAEKSKRDKEDMANFHWELGHKKDEDSRFKVTDTKTWFKSDREQAAKKRDSQYEKAHKASMDSMKREIGLQRNNRLLAKKLQKESYTQYFGDSAKVTGSSHKVGDRVKTHDGLVGKVTKVSKSHVEVRGHPYQHADVKKIKTGQEKADEVASAMDKLRQHLRSKGFKSVRKEEVEEVNEVFGRLKDKLGPMNAFHPKTGKTSERGFDRSGGPAWVGTTRTGDTVTADDDRASTHAAHNILHGHYTTSKKNRAVFAKKGWSHVEAGEHHDVFKGPDGKHWRAHHDGETGTIHVSAEKSRTRTEEVVSEEGDAPTNSMGSSASDPNTGNVQGVSPLLGTCKPSKRKELEKQMKAMLKK